jgi:DnaJ-class molecular chaperone
VRWFLILLVPAILIGQGKPVPSLLSYAVIIAVCYAVSLALHSNRRCRKCGGSGRQRAAMFTWGDRLCTTCGGQSRHRRWGVQAFYPQSKTYAERVTAEARKRRGRLR